MTKLMRHLGRGEKGFTLVELVVVIAILGVLAAIATPLVVNFLGQSKESAYKAETDVIQAAVEGYFADPTNARFLGQRTYPLVGRGQTNQITLQNLLGANELIDQLSSTGTQVFVTAPPASLPPSTAAITDALWSPNGGTEGKDISTTWVDGGKAATPTPDGVRDSVQPGATATASEDTWATVTATRGTVAYQVDPRYYIIDMDELVTKKFMDKPAKSASRDNCPTTTTACTGSYIWYVDGAGRVGSLLNAFPKTKGYADVFP